MSLKEKELQLKKMMEDELEAKSGHHTPEGLFTKPTKDIVDGLLKDAHGDEELALRRITFYINRAGDGLSNKTAVNAAKRELEKKVEAKREAKKASFHDVLSEYFNKAYHNMFEKNDKDGPKLMSPRKSLDYLLDNDINVAWMLGSPHPEVVDTKRNKALGLFGVLDDGTLLMRTHKAKEGEPGGKAHWFDEDIHITPQEFKDMLEDDKNNESQSPWTKDIYDHYQSVENEKDILKSGDKLFDAWIKRFYDENKEDLGLENLYDKKSNRYNSKVYDEFIKFWDELPDYEKERYAPNVPDPWGLATLDVHKSMPVIRKRQRASSRKLNSKTVRGSVDAPKLATPKEQDAWETYQVLNSIAENDKNLDRKINPGFFEAIKSIVCDDRDNIKPDRSRIEYWKNTFIGDEPEKFAKSIYPELNSADKDQIKDRVRAEVMKKVLNSTSEGKKDLAAAEKKAEEIRSKTRDNEEDPTEKESRFIRYLPDKYKNDESIAQEIAQTYEKEIARTEATLNAARKEAEAEKRAEIIEDNPDLDKYAELMSRCEKLYKSWIEDYRGMYGKVDADEPITKEDIEDFEKAMKDPDIDGDFVRRRYGPKYLEVKLVNPLEMVRRVKDFDEKFPGLRKDINQWKKDTEDPNIEIRTVIVSSNPWVVEKEVRKKVGKNSDGSDRWETVTDDEEKQALLQKKTAKKPEYKLGDPEELKNLRKNDETMEDKVKRCLKTYLGDKYVHFADEVISSGEMNGKEDKWVISGVIERPGNNNPRFQITSTTNDGFKYPVYVPLFDADHPRECLAYWLKKYNNKDEKPEKEPENNEEDNDDDNISLADLDKYRDQILKNNEESGDNEEEEK